MPTHPCGHLHGQAKAAAGHVQLYFGSPLTVSAKITLDLNAALRLRRRSNARRAVLTAMHCDYRSQSLQFWKLEVTDGSAVLIAFADVGEELFIRHEMPFTDFPLYYIEI